MFNKKGVVELGLIFLVIVALVFIGWLININNRECSSNSGCSNEQYCGSDFNCHNIPIIEKQVKSDQVSMVKPAFILGISGIIIALILRWDRLSLPFKKKPKKKQKVYYESVDTNP